jgi:glycosyltransferase involved in cell wall biosynthesis
MTNMPLVAICVATFRRPRYLSKLLESINGIQVEGYYPHVIVVDNDSNGEARRIVEEWGGESVLPYTYVIEPVRGIAAARNRLVTEARAIGADYIAFVDDDETVSQRWLTSLLCSARSNGADVATGPVVYTYDADVPRWMSAGEFLQREEFPEGTRVSDFFTCNVLINLDCLNGLEQPFDDRFSLTGGSDIFLAQQLVRNGIRIVWSDEARVYETVPPSRATVSWLMRRWYRNGMVRTRILFILESGLAPRLVRLAKCCVWLVRGVVSIVPSVVRGKAGVVRSLQRCAQAAGGLAGAISMISYKEYNRTHGE